MVLPISVIPIDFDTILPVWQQFLWPGRSSTIRPVCPMLFLGVYDMKVCDKYVEDTVFYGAYDSSNLLCAVCSGHPTSATDYRLRGLYCLPDYESLGLRQNMIQAIYNAAKAVKRDVVWCMPRLGAVDFFERSGFVQMSEPFIDNVEYGPNVYMARMITV